MSDLVVRSLGNMYEVGGSNLIAVDVYKKKKKRLTYLLILITT